MKTETFHVEGMSCGHCEVAVQQAVRKLPGIQKVKANRRKKQAVITYDESQTTPGQIVAAVNATGYEAATKQASTSFV